VGEAGLLVAPEVAPLAEAMQRVLDDPALRERLREQGLARARRFSWSATARATLAVYERVATGPASI
jgi:alpha-1,3-rhamnosyl/mannosyltransferase